MRRFEMEGGRAVLEAMKHAVYPCDCIVINYIYIRMLLTGQRCLTVFFWNLFLSLSWNQESPRPEMSQDQADLGA